MTLFVERNLEERICNETGSKGTNIPFDKGTKLPTKFYDDFLSSNQNKQSTLWKYMKISTNSLL